MNIRLSAGWVHTVLASDDGVFYGFGIGKNGELGHSVGFTEFTASAVELNLPPIKKPASVQVAVGAKHTLVLADGNVYSTGLTDDGRLGHNLVHGQIKFPNVDKITYITAGSDASHAVSEDGSTIYAWGLGYTTTNAPEPIAIKIEARTPICMVACGTEHSLALSLDGTVWSWGRGRNGRLGHGNEADCKEPTIIKSLIVSDEQRIVQVCCGDSHNLALNAEGRIYAWGSGAYGRLGLGMESDAHIPTVIDTLADVRAVAISANSFTSCCIVVPDTTEYSLYTWGGGKYDKLGHGDSLNRSKPKAVEYFKKPIRAIRAVCGQHHMVAVTEENRVLAWGAAAGARCGVKTDESAISTPRIVNFFNDKRLLTAISAEVKELDQPRSEGYRCRAIACGERHTIALAITDVADNARNVILAWGANSQGQLGVGRMPQSPRPLPVALNIRAGVNILKVVCGGNFSMCLTDQGTIYSWGGNEKGQLGLGDTSPRYKPEVVKALQGTYITSITAGWSHVAAVASPDSPQPGDRESVYVWGDNQYGQLGLSTDLVPVQFPCTPSYHVYPKPLRLPTKLFDADVDRIDLTNERITVSLGTTHSMILVTCIETDSQTRKACRLLTCGTSKYNQLGPYANNQSCYPFPTLVAFANMHGDDRQRNPRSPCPFIHLIAASERASIAVSNPADIDIVYVWGELPGVSLNGPDPTPRAIESLTNASKLKAQIGSDIPISDFKVLDVVSARAHHMLLCRYNEKASHGRAPVVFGWGETQYGKLGLGNVAKHLEDKQLSETVAARSQSSEKKDGAGVEGKDGEDLAADNTSMTVIGPELIRSFKNIRIRGLSTKADHNALVTEDGEAYVWGYGDSGRLGLGDGKSTSSSLKSANLPQQMAIFDKGERQKARSDRKRAKEHQEEKNQDEELEGTTAHELAKKAKALRGMFTKQFKLYKSSNAKLILEKIELIHAAITQRITESQGHVDSLTSRFLIENANNEKKILKIRALKAKAAREEALARQRAEEESKGVRLEEEAAAQKRIDKPDSGSCTGCGTAEDDWDDIDVESVGDADEQDMAGFMEEKALAHMVSFERDLLNSAEMLVTRLYMQPCMMMRAYTVYSDSIQSIIQPTEKDEKEAAAQKRKDAKEKKKPESEQAKNAKLVKKLESYRARFCNLAFGIYDLHRDEDILTFQVFLRLMLIQATRGKTKQMILTEDSLEWSVFRQVFLVGRIRRSLADVLAKALSELPPFPSGDEKKASSPSDYLIKYSADKDVANVTEAFRLVHTKAEQFLTSLMSSQYLPFIVSLIQRPVVTLISALRKNKIDPVEVVGRIVMRVLAEVMLADQSYQFEIKCRQQARKGFGFPERNKRDNDDEAEEKGDGEDKDKDKDKDTLASRGGKGYDKELAMKSEISSGASFLGPSETLILLYLKDIGSEIGADDVTDMMLYITGRHKIPDYIMKNFGGIGGSPIGQGSNRPPVKLMHKFVEDVVEQLEKVESIESKGASAVVEQNELDLLTHFLKMPFMFPRRVVQIPRNSFLLLEKSRELASEQDMRKALKEVGIRIEDEQAAKEADWGRANIRLDPTRCDFESRRKSSDEPCEQCRCMHPRFNASSSSVAAGTATGAVVDQEALKAEQPVTLKKHECDKMYEILVEDETFSNIIEEMDGESTWLAIMAELKNWRKKQILLYGEQEGSHNYEVAAYSFKRLMRIAKHTRVELGEKHDLVTFIADSTSIDPVLLRQRLKEREEKKRLYTDEEQRKVKALTALKDAIMAENNKAQFKIDRMATDFVSIKSKVLFDPTYLENKFNLNPKNTEPKALRKFTTQLRPWTEVRIVRERGKVLRFTYADLVAEGILYRVRPLRKYLPCVGFCCLKAFSACHCMDAKGRNLIEFLTNISFIFITSADPDIVNLKVSYRPTQNKDADLVILRSVLVSLKALTTQDCVCHRITYNPLGDDVPLTDVIVFQFSKSRLKRMLQQFPRNVKDEGRIVEDDPNDVI